MRPSFSRPSGRRGVPRAGRRARGGGLEQAETFIVDVEARIQETPSLGDLSLVAVLPPDRVGRSRATLTSTRGGLSEHGA